ncbi:hypothetical protein ABIB87_001363 [Bradyrhizobium sp. JR18.2]
MGGPMVLRSSPKMASGPYPTKPGMLQASTISTAMARPTCFGATTMAAWPFGPWGAQEETRFWRVTASPRLPTSHGTLPIHAITTAMGRLISFGKTATESGSLDFRKAPALSMAHLRQAPTQASTKGFVAMGEFVSATALFACSSKATRIASAYRSSASINSDSPPNSTVTQPERAEGAPKGVDFKQISGG